MPPALLMQRLKRETESLHRAVEDQLDLLDPDLALTDLAWAIGSLYGFWAGTEPALATWLSEDAALTSTLDWPRRGRRLLLTADLRSLDVDASLLPVAPQVFASVGPAEVLGWLYVAEGSTLGGAIIDRQLRRLPHIVATGLSAFTPYPEGPGPMWRSYADAVQQWAAAAPDRPDAVVRAAVATFDSLDRWLTLCHAGAPA